MNGLLRATWALTLALCLATTLLIPQTLLDLFPAETSGYLIISEPGVNPDQLQRIGTQTGVEVVQVRHTTEFSDTPEDSVMITSAEILGHRERTYARPPLSSALLPESISYGGASKQDDALGGWFAIGSDSKVERFVSTALEQWADKVSYSGVLRPGTTTAAALHSGVGISLFLTEVVLGLVIALGTASQSASFQYARMLGRSHAELYRDLLRTNLLLALRWVVLPLMALTAVLACDIYASAVLSIHRMTAELIAGSLVLTLLSVTIGTLAGWAVLLRGCAGRWGVALRGGGHEGL